ITVFLSQGISSLPSFLDASILPENCYLCLFSFCYLSYFAIQPCRPRFPQAPAVGASIARPQYAQASAAARFGSATGPASPPVNSCFLPLISEFPVFLRPKKGRYFAVTVKNEPLFCSFCDCLPFAALVK
ncbi:MAG: hypothetical protein IKS05_07305, partial [Oscillospiraceae bacterium]|nr:hypothetical protein [Oscillospiraceae bacterium]